MDNDQRLIWEAYLKETKDPGIHQEYGGKPLVPGALAPGVSEIALRLDLQDYMMEQLHKMIGSSSWMDGRNPNSPYSFGRRTKTVFGYIDINYEQPSLSPGHPDPDMQGIGPLHSGSSPNQLMRFFISISPGSNWSVYQDNKDEFIYWLDGQSVGSQAASRIFNDRKFTQEELDKTPRIVKGRYFWHETEDELHEIPLEIDGNGIPDVEPFITQIYKMLGNWDGSGGFGGFGGDGGDDEPDPDPVPAPVEKKPQYTYA